MAKKGRIFIFHGAYGSKRKAKRHEKKGEFILKRPVRGHERYLLLSRKGK